VQLSDKVKNLKVLYYGGEEYKISQYADDTYLFLDGSEESMKEAYTVLKWFYDVSGLKHIMDWVNGGF
jgi:hypothetical protein